MTWCLVKYRIRIHGVVLSKARDSLHDLVLS